jgi:hypothetical protein
MLLARSRILSICTIKIFEVYFTFLFVSGYGEIFAAVARWAICSTYCFVYSSRPKNLHYWHPPFPSIYFLPLTPPPLSAPTFFSPYVPVDLGGF